jgi:hypothetical protein
LDFEEFINGFGGPPPENLSDDTKDWLTGNSHIGPLLKHIMEGVAADAISPVALVEALFTIIHPDTSPQGLDVLPLFSAAAHAVGKPSIIDFFHGMHIIHIPGAFALLCSVHNKIDCPCGEPPTRSLRDATKEEQAAVHQCIKACFASTIPDELAMVDQDDGDYRLVRFSEEDLKDKPELMDKMVRNFRREIDREIPTIIPDHERNDEPGGPDWMKRWT